MKLTPQQKQMLFPVILITGLVLGYLYLWTPLQNQVKQGEQEYSDKKRKLDEVIRQANRKDILDRQLSGLRAELEEVKKRLPKEKEIPGLLRTLASVAEKNRIMLSTIAPQSPRAGQYVTDLVFSIQSAGSYHTIARFLTELGQEQRIINIENLQLVATGNPNDLSRNLGSNFLMVTYIFKEGN